MPFTEKQKLGIKKKAAFRCCRCHEIGIDIHHIIPQALGGADIEDNAAPLCQNCHDRFGDNRQKRKEITQMRDWWYDVVGEKYPITETSKLEKLNDQILDLNEKSVTKDQLDDKVKQIIKEIDMLKKRDRDEAKAVSSNDAKRIINNYASMTKLGNNVGAGFHCKKCNATIGLLIGNIDKCPFCKAPIE